MSAHPSLCITFVTYTVLIITEESTAILNSLGVIVLDSYCKVVNALDHEVM